MKKPESPSAPDGPDRVMIDVKALLRRKAEIAEERISPQETLARLNAEERDLDLILGYARDGRFTVDTPVASPAGGVSRAKRNRELRVTHRVIVVLALEQQPDGASVGQIVQFGVAADVTEKKVVRTSISPLLKKMADPERNMMEVEHDEAGRRWIITKRGRKTAEDFRSKWVEAGGVPFWNMVADAVEDAE